MTLVREEQQYEDTSKGQIINELKEIRHGKLVTVKKDIILNADRANKNIQPDAE